MVIDLQDLKIDLDKSEIIINDKIISSDEAVRISVSYLCMRVYRYLVKNYMDNLKQLYGENCTEEEIFKVATNVQLLVTRDNLGIYDATQKFLATQRVHKKFSNI
jgi:hypothetical protein